MPWKRLIDVTGKPKIQIIVFDIHKSGNEILLCSYCKMRREKYDSAFSFQAYTIRRGNNSRNVERADFTQVSRRKIFTT